MLGETATIKAQENTQTEKKVYVTEKKTFWIDEKNNEFVSELINKDDRRDSFARRINQVIKFARELNEANPDAFKDFLNKEA